MITRNPSRRWPVYAVLVAMMVPAVDTATAADASSQPPASAQMQRFENALARLAVRPEQAEAFQAAMNRYIEARNEVFAREARRGLNAKSWQRLERRLKPVGGALKDELEPVLDPDQNNELKGFVKLMNESFVEVQRAQAMGARGGRR